MKIPFVRKLMTILLLLIYINRGFFISSAIEMESPDGEINSVAELLAELITGESNGIDEDGDMQTECNFVQIIQHDFSQQLTQSLELVNLSSEKILKFNIPNKEEIPPINFFNKIDKPPEV
jgi:hypothetical protein